MQVCTHKCKKKLMGDLYIICSTNISPIHRSSSRHTNHKLLHLDLIVEEIYFKLLNCYYCTYFQAAYLQYYDLIRILKYVLDKGSYSTMLLYGTTVQLHTQIHGIILQKTIKAVGLNYFLPKNCSSPFPLSIVIGATMVCEERGR